MLIFNYVDTPNNNLVCCICRAPFHDPVTTSTCQHTFCRECILRALIHVPQCPVDRLPLSEEELEPASPIIRSLVDELIVECVYQADGCDYRGERQLLPLHLKEKCIFSEEGRHRSEKAAGKARSDEKHDRLTETAEDLAKGKAATGSADVDPASSRNASFTSPTSGSSQLPSSSSSDPSTSRPDPRLNQLTEQNILLRYRVDTLESVVQVFKKEMAAVKTILEPWMRNAMSTPRPTWRRSVRHLREIDNISGLSVNGQVLSSSTAPAAAHEDSYSVPEQVRNRATGLRSPSISAPGDRDSSVSPTNNASHSDDLASYFPAEDEVRVWRPSQSQMPEQPSGPTQRQRPGHDHHHSVSSSIGLNSVDPYSNVANVPGGYPSNLGYTMGPGNYSILSPPFPGNPPYGTAAPSLTPGAVSPVQAAGLPAPQPINFSMPELELSSPSLAHTLHDLNSTIGSLSSVVEEVNRKTDVALSLIGGGGGVTIMGGGVMGEVLRLGEEMMGVRASVQGLRMQVHGMLMGAVGMGGTPGVPTYLGRPPASPSSTNNGMSDDDPVPQGRAQLPGQMGMPANMNARFGFPGPLGITKL